MRYIVSYDIPDTPRRTKISKILDDFGDRVQYSVFECLLDKALYDKMIRRLEGVVKEDEDSIRIYALCAMCERAMVIMGKGDIIKDEKYYIL